MKLIFLSCYIACVCASPHVLNPKPPVQNKNLCTYGPTLSCKNITSSALPPTLSSKINLGDNTESNKISDSVISDKTVTSVDTPSCVMCDLVLDRIEEQTALIDTEEGIKNIVNQICEYAPAYGRYECAKLIMDNADSIIELLIQKVDPADVCATICICGKSQKTLQDLRKHHSDHKDQSRSVQIREKQKILPAQSTGNSQCTFCQYFVSYVKGAITVSSTEASIIEVVDEACAALPKNVAQTCSEFVDSYGPTIVGLLYQGMEPLQICTIMRVCSSSQVQKRNVKEITDCPLCLLTITNVIEAVGYDFKEANLKQALLEECSYFLETMATRCIYLVNTYGDQIIDELVEEFTPEEICIHLQLCQKNPELSIEPHSNSFGGSNWRAKKSSGSTANGKTNLTVDVENSPLCVTCNFVLIHIGKQLAENDTEDQVKHAVLNICAHTPKSSQRQCHQFIYTYGNAIIQLLIQEHDPDNICTSLGLCGTSKKNT